MIDLYCEYFEDVMVKMNDSCAIYPILGLSSYRQKAKKAPN